MNTFTKLDLAYLKKELRSYQLEKNIPYPKLGEILGSTSKTSSGRGAFARAFFEAPDYDISMKQIVSIAQFLGRDVKSVLFRDKNSVIHSEGDHAMNAINMEQGEVRQEKHARGNLGDESSVIQYLQSCSDLELENISNFIEYLKIKRNNKAFKKK